ncbi:uncharacterized protein B0T15DRAFT_289901 [Chaetomium strumarium]|uniref:Uncharacterized protein n=1 Tax=Chaetomium strumarium TaxID=1170767 RepID=A0AAJ0LY84_9PEZI|nr:hypothetical protein B0T15DRAFT_289901 [Chaetomium strumarium]
MSDILRRVGRGGAGNFYSKKDVQEAANSTPPDLEAQNNSAEPLANAVTRTQTHSTSSGPSYSRTGRGGAGNFTFRSAGSDTTAPSTDPNSSTAQQEERDLKEQAAVAVAATIAAKPRAGELSGRGGAGNWTGHDGVGAELKEEEERQKKAAELEMQVLRDVEVGLAPPPRAYHHPGRGGRRKGEELTDTS